MSQYLAALYSQIYGLCLDVSLIEYCDPNSLNAAVIAHTANKVNKLCECLSYFLQKQNNTEASALSLELDHLLFNLKARLLNIYTAFSNKGEFFKALHSHTGVCVAHATISVQFFNGCGMNLSFTFVNDVEDFFKKLNSVCYCISAPQALAALQEALDFLRVLRGVSPVPCADVYLCSRPCLECFLEMTVLPNQGETINAMLINCSCPHICRPINPEPIQGIFENEIKQAGVNMHVLSVPAQTSASDQYAKLMQDSLTCLKEHTIFSQIPKQIMELSNLIYWSSGQKQPGDSQKQCSQLTKIIHREKEMNEIRHSYASGNKRVHFFDTRFPSGVELLFSGCIYSSTADVIAALKKDCSTTFLNQTQFASLMQRQNELFTRLSNLLYEHNSSTGEVAKKHGERSADVSFHLDAPKEQVIEEAKLRKEAYLQKLSKEGIKKLQACLDSHGEVLKNQLALRVWGSTIYKQGAALLNHFLFRESWVKCEATAMTQPTPELFENSKFIKNSLYANSLSREHTCSLKLQFFSLINGPLTSKTGSMFPAPDNVKLAHCLDAANVMPHQKMLLSEMIHCGLEPKDWVNALFNEFYTITEKDLNSIQYQCWKYVRELVLSVALYNRVWEKDLCIYKTDSIQPNSLPHALKNGIYFTYEDKAPLILLSNGQKWIFKDLYALLYMHMQIVSAQNG